MTTKFTWYGHATLGLETGGYKIIVDPFFSGNPAASDSAEAVESLNVSAAAEITLYSRAGFNQGKK